MKANSSVQTPIILFGNGKGGAGKTTSSIMTALAFATANFRVGVRDTDTQGSLTNCLHLDVFKDLPIATAPRGSEDAFDVVIADGPPSIDEPGFLADYDRCNLFCLVTRTGTLDLQTTVRSYDYLLRRRPDAKIVLLINAYSRLTRLDRDLDGNLAAAGIAHVPRLRVPLSERQIYRHVVYAGWAGITKFYRPDDVKVAQDETAAIAMEIYGLARNGK